MSAPKLYVGMDVCKATISIAVAESSSSFCIQSRETGLTDEVLLNFASQSQIWIKPVNYKPEFSGPYPRRNTSTARSAILRASAGVGGRTSGLNQRG